MTAALTQFKDIESHRGYLIRYARAQLRDEALAEEVVQEALLAALESIGGFGGKSSLRTWLTSILRFKIIDWQRKITFERATLVSTGADQEASAAEDFFDQLFDATGHPMDLGRPWVDPDQALENKQFWKALERCMDALPPTTSRVFFKRDVLGFDTDTICKEEGITASNCWVMLHRARMGLRACLDANWFHRGASAKGKNND